MSFGDAHRQRIGTQSLPVALLTNSRRNELVDCDSHALGRRFMQTFAQPVERALPIVLISVESLRKHELRRRAPTTNRNAVAARCTPDKQPAKRARRLRFARARTALHANVRATS